MRIENMFNKYLKLTEQGDADVQYSLGFMYAKGRGVAKDYILAHAWANIAAYNGEQKAAKLRDDGIAKKMTESDITTAQDMASRCVANGYKECRY